MIKNCGCLPNEVRFKKEIICHCIIPSMQTFFFVPNTLHIIWKVFILCRHSSKTIWKHSKHIFQHLFHWWIIHITYPGMKETTQHCKILHHNESWQWSSIEFPHVYTEECTLLVPPIPQTSLNLDIDANMELIVLDGGNRQWGAQRCWENLMFLWLSIYIKPNLFPHLSLILITEDLWTSMEWICLQLPQVGIPLLQNPLFETQYHTMLVNMTKKFTPFYEAQHPEFWLTQQILRIWGHLWLNLVANMLQKLQNTQWQSRHLRSSR